MAIIDEGQVVIQPLQRSWYGRRVTCVDMLRLDMLHPVVSGNKWFKLKRNLAYASDEGYKTILTFGGAYSNHLIAAAAAAKYFGLSSVGIVRGLHAEGTLTPTLKQCKLYGMHLQFATREMYQHQKKESFFSEMLSKQYADAFILPEGGANQLGRTGAEDIAKLIPDKYTHVCLSVGTATTFIGLRNALPIQQMMCGFAPMKKGRYLQDEIIKYTGKATASAWKLFDEWHFGGFGKHSEALILFMNEFYELNRIPLDVVYTAKMMYGIKQMINFGNFDPEAKILCIHSGGIQGNASIAHRLSF